MSSQILCQSETIERHVPPASYRNIATFLLVIATSVFLSGCGVTLSPVKRAPVHISPLETSLPPITQPVLVRFESTLPARPLAETVWDNVSGAFADDVESKQIGFTQDYSKLIPAAAIGGAVGGAIVGTKANHTRIVIPFGRIFQGVFEPGLQKVFPNSRACFDASCELKESQSATQRYVVRLKVAEFQVWEEPLNHINMKAMVECKVYRAGITNQPNYTYEARHQATNQSLGSIMTTSSGFIRELNKISNRFAGALSGKLLENLQRELAE